MLKKFFVAMFLTVFALVSNNICSAKMPRSEMYLGGLTEGSKYNEMVRIYGEPTEINPGYEYISTYKYGNSVEIVHYSYRDSMCSIKVTDNNGWKTPSGLAVGQNISKVLDLYGNADYTESGTAKTAYCYFGEMYYSNDFKRNVPGLGFIIVFNKNSGKILEMGVYGSMGRSSGFSEYYRGMIEDMVK